MTMESISNFAKVAGVGFGASTSTLSLRTILTELQGLKRGVAVGVGSGESAGFTGMSAGRGDTLLSVISGGTTGVDLDITGSCAISNDRIVITDATTTNRTIDALWFSKGGA